MKQRRVRNGLFFAAALAIAAAITGHVSGPAADAQAVRIPPPPASGVPIPVVDLQSALTQTSAVIEGLVTAIQYEYSDDQGPWTRVTLANVRPLFGSAVSVGEIRHFGGPLPDGRLVVASELPVFVEGKEYIVFLRNTKWNLSPVVGDLALRVEAVEGNEVLVNSDGQAITGVGAAGVTLGPALFEGPQRDGTAPQPLAAGLSLLERKPLDRGRFVDALRSAMATQALQVAGTFSARPAGEFKWRGQAAAASPGDGAAALARPSSNVGPELDTSEAQR
jgi:hypothetical protein